MTDNPRERLLSPRCSKCQKNDGVLAIGEVRFCRRCRADVLAIHAERKSGKKRKVGTILQCTI
jgi:hypothetical protein